jgi:hypothetical protein
VGVRSIANTEGIDKKRKGMKTAKIHVSKQTIDGVDSDEEDQDRAE